MSPGFSSPPNPKVFQATVWELARQVSPGTVTTYGQIAAMIPPPGTLNLKDYEAFGARWVGGAMAACPADVPWQRVINSQGKVSARPGAELQRQLLEAEGVQFDERDKVDFKRFGWNGPDPEWCRARGLFPAAPLGQGQSRLF
jgi:methylated-DNA-protein-cysteine methyltransferase-like protein